MSTPKTSAREFAVQFLYQCEAEKIFYFSMPHLESFIGHFNVPTKSREFLEALARGALENMDRIDATISEHSKNWKISRMASTDRAILRLAVFELLEMSTPHKVVLDEAIEMAKTFGTDHSSGFVNGILDGILKSLPKHEGGSASDGNRAANS